MKNKQKVEYTAPLTGAEEFNEVNADSTHAALQSVWETSGMEHEQKDCIQEKDTQ